MDLTTLRYLDTEAKLLNPYARDLEPAEGDTAFVSGYVVDKGVDPSTRTVSGMTSTRSIDRYEEIIEPKAFEPWLGAFLANPQFLAGHRMGGMNGEPTSIGQWSDLRIVEDGLWGRATFMDPGDPLADAYWRRYEQGVLRAFSVGVIVHEWAMQEFELEPGVSKRIRVFSNVELLEISAVSVPANRQSLVRAAALADDVREPASREAEALARRLDETLGRALVERVSTTVEAAIKKILITDPDGLLARLIADVAEACFRCPDPGAYGDPPGMHALDDPPAAGPGGDDERTQQAALIASLRELNQTLRRSGT
jgi:HK97 family phage prohead protease